MEEIRENRSNKGSCMENNNDYDLPSKILHLSFALLFMISFSIGKFVDDDSKIYAFHMLSGILMGIVLILRILWGILGAKKARFSNFNLSLSGLKTYLKRVLSGEKISDFHRNPASSLVTLGLYGVAALMIFSGGLMVLGGPHFFEELHEVLSLLFLVLVLIHLSGVVVHQYQNRDQTVLNIFKLSKDYFIIAMIFIITISSAGGYLFQNYNHTTQELNILNQKILLGEKDKGQKYDYDEEDEDDD